MLTLNRIITVLNEMSTAFSGVLLTELSFNMAESIPKEDKWYGFANQKMFRIENGHCVYLSHKRKL